MLPSLEDVSTALDEYHEYHEYHGKKGRFESKLLWVRAERVSPADFWRQEAPKVKWLNVVGETVLSLAHSAGGAERSWSTHNNIFSDRRQSQLPSTLGRNVRMFCNMRLRDHVLGRGR